MKCGDNGFCNHNKICQCKAGYTGQYCQTAFCFTQCLNGGNCTAPSVCTCPDGYQGTYCEGGKSVYLCITIILFKKQLLYNTNIYIHKYIYVKNKYYIFFTFLNTFRNSNSCLTADFDNFRNCFIKGCLFSATINTRIMMFLFLITELCYCIQEFLKV